MKQTGQEPGGELASQFRILIVSAVRMCKQCLLIVSVSGGRTLRYSPLMKVLRTVTNSSSSRHYEDCPSDVR